MKTLTAALALAGTLFAAQAHAAVYDFAFSDTTLLSFSNTNTVAPSPDDFTSPVYTFTLDTSTANGGPIAGTTFNNVNIYNSGSLVSTDTIYFNPTLGAPPAGTNAIQDDATTVRSMSATGGAYDFSFSPAVFATGNGSNISFATGAYGGTDSTRDENATIVISAPAVSAAPEPGAWALMLGGVGMLGVFLRIQQARRREDEARGMATA